MKYQYQTLKKIMAADEEENSFRTPFARTEKINEFISEFGLEDEIEGAGESEEEDENYEKVPMARLTPETAEELKRTQDLFASHTTAEERIEDAKNMLQEKTLEMALRDAPGLKDKLEVEVTYDHNHNLNYAAFKIELIADGETVEMEPSAFYYSYEPWIGGQEGASSWSWMAWLGIEDSPFFSSDFLDDYDADQVSIALEQFVHTMDESSYPEDLKQEAQKLEKQIGSSPENE